MHLTVATICAAAAVGLCGAAASAQPCPVELRYAAETSSPGTFAVGFRAYTDGSAELRLTLYATDGTTYAANLNTTFARPAVSDAGVVKLWVSDSSYVRLPPQTVAIEAATLDVIDPDTHRAMICSGNQILWSIFARRFGNAQVQSSWVDAGLGSDLARALQAFASASSIVVANPLPPVGKPNCVEPSVDAKIKKISRAEYPFRAKSMGDTGATAILVDLDETGKLTGTFLYERSGSDDLDEAALAAAIATTYSPQFFRCVPVSGLYLFRVEFTR